MDVWLGADVYVVVLVVNHDT